jgi:hypothetical protein
MRDVWGVTLECRQGRRTGDDRNTSSVIASPQWLDPRCCKSTTRLRTDHHILVVEECVSIRSGNSQTATWVPVPFGSEFLKPSADPDARTP